MRNNKLYLVDILDAADHVAAFLEGKGFEDFKGDELLKSATLQKLIVIGEAAARVSSEFKEKHTEVEWPDIVAFRNIAVHAYFAVNWRIVWETAKKDVPELKDKISNILRKEFSDKCFASEKNVDGVSKGSSRVERVQKPRECPKCGHAPLADIVYGRPDYNNEKLEREISEGKITLGGCFVSDDDPQWECTHCGLIIFRSQMQ